MRNLSITRRVAVGLLATGLATPLVGCGAEERPGLAEGGWEEVVAAAEKEGEVVFYHGSTEQQADRLVAAFTKQYPTIEVRAERGGSEIFARVEAEMSSGVGGADLFLVGDGEWFVKHKDELLDMPEGPGVGGLAEDAWVVEGKAAVASATPYSMFVWNTDVFPGGFEDYDDFLAPAAKGRVAFRGDASKSAAGFLDFLESSVGEDYLVRLGEQSPKLYPSVVPATEAVASGEVGATLAALPPHVIDLIDSGAPIDYLYPDPGYAFEYGVAALENAEHPNAAAVLTDFIMSAEGQTALNGGQYGIASRDGIEGAVASDGWKRLDSTRYTPEVLDEWNAKLDEYLS